MSKKVVVLNGSPIVGGNADAMSDLLVKGVQEAGNEAQKIRLSDLNIAPYTGFGQTVDEDDMKQVFEAITSSDIIVFASPLYWMQFTAQIKTMMDRLSFEMKDALAGKETALLVCAASPEEVVRKNIVPYYQMCFIESLGWKDRGTVLAGGVFGPGDVEKTPYAQQAYELGKAL